MGGEGKSLREAKRGAATKGRHGREFIFMNP